MATERDEALRAIYRRGSRLRRQRRAASVTAVAFSVLSIGGLLATVTNDTREPVYAGRTDEHRGSISTPQPPYGENGSICTSATIALVIWMEPGVTSAQIAAVDDQLRKDPRVMAVHVEDRQGGGESNAVFAGRPEITAGVDVSNAPFALEGVVADVEDARQLDVPIRRLDGVYDSAVVDCSKPVAVPSVVGLQLGAARELITGLGLGGRSAEEVNDPPEATVYTQLPLASALVPKGTSITLSTIAPDPPATAECPDARHPREVGSADGLPYASALALENVLAARIATSSELLGGPVSIAHWDRYAIISNPPLKTSKVHAYQLMVQLHDAAGCPAMPQFAAGTADGVPVTFLLPAPAPGA